MSAIDKRAVDRALAAAATALHVYYERDSNAPTSAPACDRYVAQIDALQVLLRHPDAATILAGVLSNHPVAGISWGVTAYRLPSSPLGLTVGPVRDGDQLVTFPTYADALAYATDLNRTNTSPHIHYIASGLPARGDATTQSAPSPSPPSAGAD